MAARIPVKAIYSGSDVTSLGEFTSSDTIAGSYLTDGSVTAAKLAADTATQAELDVVSGVATAALPKAGGTMTGDIIFADGEGISLGAGVDLTLLSDGSTVKFQGDDMRFRSKDGTETYFDLAKNAGIGLRYDNSTKIATTSTGVTVTGGAVGTMTTDNDGSFAMSASNNFKCTPAGNFALTFTSIVAQSGNILFINSGGHTISAHANTKVDANFLATISTAGTYLLAYFSDGTNVYMTNSAVYT